MHMVRHTADDDGLAIEVFEDAAEVAMQFISERFVVEERTAFFGCEHGVKENFGARLRHTAPLVNRLQGEFNSFIASGRFTPTALHQSAQGWREERAPTLGQRPIAAFTPTGFHHRRVFAGGFDSTRSG